MLGGAAFQNMPPYALRWQNIAVWPGCNTVTYLPHLVLCDRLAAIALQRVWSCVLCVYANVNQTPFKTKAKQYQHLPNTSHSKGLPAMCKLFLSLAIAMRD